MSIFFQRNVIFDGLTNLVSCTERPTTEIEYKRIEKYKYFRQLHFWSNIQKRHGREEKKQEIISPLVMRISKYSHIFLRTIFVAFHHHNCWIWFYVYFCLVSPEMSKLLCMRKTKQWICDNYISLLTFCWNVLTLFFTQFSTLLA